MMPAKWNEHMYRIEDFKKNDPVLRWDRTACQESLDPSANREAQVHDLQRGRLVIESAGCALSLPPEMLCNRARRSLSLSLFNAMGITALTLALARVRLTDVMNNQSLLRYLTEKNGIVTSNHAKLDPAGL